MNARTMRRSFSLAPNASLALSMTISVGAYSSMRAVIAENDAVNTQIAFPIARGFHGQEFVIGCIHQPQARVHGDGFKHHTR